MKTKIKHLSKCALSAVLAVAMLMSTTLVGSVSAVGTAETTGEQTEAVQNDTAEPAAEQTAEETEQKNDAEDAVAAAVPEKKALQASGDGTYKDYYLIGRLDFVYSDWRQDGFYDFGFDEVGDNLYKCETGKKLKEWTTTTTKKQDGSSSTKYKEFKVVPCDSSGNFGTTIGNGSNGLQKNIFSYNTPNKYFTTTQNGSAGNLAFTTASSDESAYVNIWLDTSYSTTAPNIYYTLSNENYYYVYYYNAAVSGTVTGTIKAYSYGNGQLLGAWNSSTVGTTMQAVSGVDNLYRIAVKSNGDTNIIFTNKNSGSYQTNDLDMPASNSSDIYYIADSVSSNTINGHWASTYETTPVVQTTHPVYFYNILGWTNIQGNYTPSGGSVQTLTATAATDIGDNWVKVEVPDTATSSDTIYFSGTRSEGINGMTIRTEAYSCPTTSSNDKYFVPMYYTYYTSKIANGPQKVGCYVQSTTSDEITLESGKSYIYLRKNSYISGWTNIFAHLYNSSSNSSVKGTTWHGYRFRKVLGYSDLYAIEAFADTTNATFNFANCNRIAVSDGKDDAHAYENSTHQVTHRFLTYALRINNVFTPLSTSSKTDTLDGSTTIYRREAEWQDFDRNLDTVAPGKVRIYAKTGTIRTDATDTYDKYSRLADVQVAFKSGGISYTANGEDNTQDRETWGVYYKRTPYSDTSSNKHYRKVIADADANQEVTITVTLRNVNNVRDRYFVKAFIINGETYQVNTHSADGVYTMSFTPNDTYGSYIEVTPVYYYNESSTYNGTGNSYITLQVDDYETVEDIWGCTVAAYAWYVDAEESTTVTTAQTGTATNALGNYPGQPMIKIGSAYYMQIPKYINGTSKTVKGVTMNNYMWDDVHSEITEFLINNNITGATDFTGGHALNGTSLRTKNERNCQTYDFDDFVALAARNANKIRFTFKYRTWHSSRGADGGNFHVGNAVLSKADATSSTTNLNQFVTTEGGNGWEALMDDYNIPVDLFANRLTWSQAYQTIDNTVNSSANTISSNDTYINQAFVESCKYNITDAVYVVSDGYENYYEYDGTTRVNDYIGEYATMWYVYKRNTDGTFRFIGALPPSAFLSDCINADGSVTQSNYLNYSATAQTYRTAGRSYTNSGKALYTTYKAIYDECANCPVVIAYESAIYSEGRTGSTGTGQLASLNRGYRCDGRWTYSKASQTVSADIEIQIVTLNSETGKVATRTLDGFATGENATGYTGSTTNADAYFTNSDFARTVSSPDVVENADKNFTFTASSFKKGTDNKYYVFKGWQVVNGSITAANRATASYSNVNSGSNVLSVDGASPMNGNMTFVATYVETDARTLVISHQLYALADTSNVEDQSTVPVVHNGTGTTQVKVEVLSATDHNDIKRTYDLVSGSRTITDQTYINSENISKYDFRITLTTTPDSDSKMYAMYELFPNTTLTTLGNTTTNTYTISGSIINTQFGSEKVLSIPNYSDLRSVSVSIKFKYYDRKVNRGTVAENVDTTPTTITVTQDRDTTSVATENTNEANNALRLKNTVGTAFTDNNIISLTNYGSTDKCSLSDISSVMDTYYFWPTQSEAESGFGGMMNLRANKTYKDNGNEVTKHADYYGFAYGERKNNGTIDHSYSGNGEKWVTYYDSSHKEVAYNDAVADPFRVASIEVWGLNRPKEIGLTFSYPKTAEEVASGTDSYTGSGSFTGYYNERVGRAGYGGSVDGLSDYLINYGVTCDSNDTRRKNITAPASFSKDNGDGTTTYYYFDGWYYGEIKVSGDQTYANRITAPMALTAKYTSSQTATAPDVVNSVTVTSNGTEKYVSDKGVSRVRLLTQINVNGYLNPATNESDETINQMAMIYVKLPADADPDNWTDENKSAIYTSVKTAVEKSLNDAKVSNVTPTGVNVFTVTIDTLDLNPTESATANTISYTYNVVWNGTATAGENITLTNKNRIQFSLDLTQSSVSDNGSNSNIIAVAAIKDNTNQTWKMSTNGIIYHNGEANGFIYGSGSTEEEQEQVEEPDEIVPVANLENVQIFSLEEEAPTAPAA